MNYNYRNDKCVCIWQIYGLEKRKEKWSRTITKGISDFESFVFMIFDHCILLT